MSSENPETNNALIKENLKPLLLSNIGFSFEIEGWLYIRQICEGFAVGEDLSPELAKALDRNGWEEVFENVDEAINCFVGYRTEQKIGADYDLINLAESGD